jgi:endo-1,4-beta-xylanase
MKQSLLSAVLVLPALCLALTARAEPEVHVPPTADPTFPELPAALPLWSGTAPGSEGHTSPLQMRWQNYQTTWYAVVTNVNVPAIIPFLPAPGKASGIAVVVCPGGGHQNLAMEHEGYAVGKWLSDHGVAVFVLEYRLARVPGSPYTVEVHSLMDAQRAIRVVRSRAQEWNVNPAAVGIMGFSAGGEVAALAATEFEKPVPGTHDGVDSVSCRPDFQALFYPGIADRRPAATPRTPPAFLCGTFDDSFHLTTPMVNYYLRLAELGVPTELHVYAQGGHGFGIRDQDKAVYSWMPLFMTWLGGLKLPPRAAP